MKLRRRELLATRRRCCRDRPLRFHAPLRRSIIRRGRCASRRLSGRRRGRHRRAADRAMAVAAARPAIHRRQPPRRQHQCRHRSGRAGRARWLHAAPGHDIECDQSRYVPASQLRFPRAISRRLPASCGSANVMEVNPAVPGQNGAGVHRLREGESRERSTWRRAASARRRTLPASLFKMMAGVDLVHVPYRGDAPALIDMVGGRVQVMFDLIVRIDRLHQIRQAARAGGDLRRRARRCCRICRRSANSCPAMRPHRSKASARPRTRRKKSSTS